MPTKSYVEEITALRRINAREPWCFVDGPNGPEPYAGDVMHLGHVLLTKVDIVGDAPVLVRTGEINPWNPTKKDKKGVVRSNTFEAPTLVWRAPVYGLTGPDSFHTCTSIFTDTSKMRAPSFSLPAGPPTLGGTCGAADRRDLIAGQEPIYICHNCYAIQGNYGNVNVQVAAAVRLAWVKMLLAENDGAAVFADTFGAAYSDYLGGTHKKMDLDYFRVHDSGDAGWNFDYYKAWVLIARAFPTKHFWLPTRDWTNPKFAALVARTPRPDNFIVRPSALHFQTAAPAGLAGFNAGTTSAYKHPKLPDPIGAGLVDFDCPAYAGEAEHTCENGIGPEGHSPCRACWTHPHLRINYQPHKASRAKYAMGLAKGRGRGRNPEGLSDDELTAQQEGNAEALIPLDRG